LVVPSPLTVQTSSCGRCGLDSSLRWKIIAASLASIHFPFVVEDQPGEPGVSEKLGE
jgi:hypothetical protein